MKPIKTISVNPTHLKFHPVADVFPPMSAREFKVLTESIHEHGQREPVWVDKDGLVVDGRHRVKACVKLEQFVDVTTYQGDDVIAFVMDENLHRRHLDESQRAMVAARLANMRQGERTDITAIAVTSTAQKQAADMLNVSVDSLQRAKRVHSDGVPELAAKVDSGEVAVSTAADIARLPKEEQSEIVARGKDQILAKAKEIRAEQHAKKKEQRREQIRTMAWPDGKYRVIYADPPWEYSNSGLDTSAAQHYETMALQDICALDVRGMAADNSVLFLWATSPLLKEALQVIEAWGFEYKTSFVWDKNAPNYGFYNSVEHEFLLLAVRGSCVPDIDERVPSVVCIDRTGRHSAKPEEFRATIDKLYPHGPRIELFAREAAKGWERWGNEAPVEEGVA